MRTEGIRMIARVGSLLLCAAVLLFAAVPQTGADVRSQEANNPAQSKACSQSCQKKFARCQIASKGTSEAHCRRNLRACANRCTDRSQRRRLRPKAG